MSIKIPQLILNVPILYRICRFCYGWVFFNMSRGRFYGVFDSLEEAKKRIGHDHPSSYGDIDLTEINMDSFMEIHKFDYPVILNLLKVRNQFKSLIDFGGHIGVKYYAYKQLVPNMHELIWKVVDVPFCVERGRKEALRRGAANLLFSSNVLEAGECDILLISGALQYVTESIGEILDSMVRFPSLIIINKLPVHLGPEIYTIENFGKAKIPYRFFNKKGFNEKLLSKNFIKIDTWTIPSRNISIPFYETRLDKFAMEGEVWENTLTHNQYNGGERSETNLMSENWGKGS
jgi:putative methyltransferase (TIGR04325 family)